MYLKISDDMTIEEVQDRFHECFPFLKIDFFSEAHKEFEPSDNKHLLSSKSKIGDIRTKHFNSVYEIKSWHTVQQVESDLKKIFGLNAQILRSDQNGNFLQTTFSDNLTLKEQLVILAGV